MNKSADPAKQRQHLIEFMGKYNLSTNKWCAIANINEGTLRSFLKGRTFSLTLKTLQKLAEAVSVSVGDLIPDEPVETDISHLPFIDHKLLTDVVRMVDEMILEKSLNLSINERAQAYSNCYNIAVEKSKTIAGKRAEVTEMMIKEKIRKSI